MKLKLLIIIALLLSGNFFVLSQNIIKSSNKVVIKGQAFYLHEVKQGETLYAISKAYNIDKKDIAMYNPTVFDGLKTGQILKIPIIKQPKDPDFIYHKIKKGETVYSLSRLYKISKKDIYTHNPQAKKGLKIGEEIKNVYKKG